MTVLCTLIIAVVVAGGGMSSAAGENDSRSAIDLRLRFVLGRDVRYRIETIKTVAAKRDEQQPFRVRVAYTFCRRTRDVSGNRATIEFRFERIEWSVRDRATARRFDSNTPRAREEPPEFGLLRRLIGKSFAVTIDHRGEIVDVHGLEQLAESTIGKKGNEQHAVAAMVGEAEWINLIRSMYAWLPPNAVFPDQEWVRDEQLSLGIVAMRRRNSARVIGRRGSMIMIQSRIDVENQPAQGVTQGKANVVATILPQDQGKATILFDVKTGLVESLQAEIAFGMRIDTRPTGAFGKRHTQKQYLRAETRIERLKR